MAETDNTLQLAVTMAEAVSAGSYTGSVMDYLLEARGSGEENGRPSRAKAPGLH